MDISEYRARFASFNSSLELVRFHTHAGQKSQLTIEEIYDRYGDLFSADTISTLKAFHEQIPASQETQRKSVAGLITSACVHYAEKKASEVSNELKRCEAVSEIAWRGETLTVEAALERIAREANKDLRRDLCARWLDSILECNDLRSARFASLNESAKLQGSENFSKLNQALDRTTISTFLRDTESSYNVALSKLLARESLNLSRDDLAFSELVHIERLPWLDEYYPALGFAKIQAETTRGFGIRTDQQLGTTLDSEPRPSRKWSAACFPIEPPRDVRVAMLQQAGAASFLDALDCTGKAQFHAWCSPNLVTRNPEFVYAADSATSYSYGYLFRYLPIEARWNLDFMTGIDDEKARRIARDVTFHMALQARRLSVEALYDPSVLTERGVEDLRVAYESSFDEAMSFRSRLEFWLFDAYKAESSLAKLRALAFSATLREHLRVRFGHRWWTSRKAGDELIDLWSTSSTYSVEELSSLLGFGELSFDLLAQVINSGLAGD